MPSIPGIINPSVASLLTSHTKCWTSRYTVSMSQTQQAQYGSDSLSSWIMPSPSVTPLHHSPPLVPDLPETPPGESSPILSSIYPTISKEMAPSNTKAGTFTPYLIQKPEPCLISSPFGVTLQKPEDFEETCIKELQLDLTSDTTVSAANRSEHCVTSKFTSYFTQKPGYCHISSVFGVTLQKSESFEETYTKEFRTDPICNITESASSNDHWIPLPSEPPRFQPTCPGYQDQSPTSQPNSTKSATMKHFDQYRLMDSTRSTGFRAVNLIPIESVPHISSDPVHLPNHSVFSISSPEFPHKYHKQLSSSTITQSSGQANNINFPHADLTPSLQRNSDSVSWWNESVRSADESPKPLREIRPSSNTLSPFCDPELSALKTSQRNMLITSDIRNYRGCRCPKCKKLEATAYKLKHSCHVPGCNEVFSTMSLLKVHLRRHHGERPYKCNWFLCRMAFSRFDALQRHSRVHTSDWVCRKCNKVFIRSEHLNNHVKTHLKEKHRKTD